MYGEAKAMKKRVAFHQRRGGGASLTTIPVCPSLNPIAIWTFFVVRMKNRCLIFFIHIFLIFWWTFFLDLIYYSVN